MKRTSSSVSSPVSSPESCTPPATRSRAQQAQPSRVQPREQERQHHAPANTTALQDRVITSMDTSPPPSASQLEPGGTLASEPMSQTLAQRHQEIARLDQQMLEVIYGNKTITNCDLLDHMARRNADFHGRPGLIQISDQELANHLCAVEASLGYRLRRCLPEARLERLMSTLPPAQTWQVLCYGPCLFEFLPEEMKTEQVLKPLLNKMPRNRRNAVLRTISEMSPELAVRLETMEEAINRDVSWACCSRADELTFELRCQALRQYDNGRPRNDIIALFKDVADPEYSKLCDLALEVAGTALEWIRPSHQSAARVDLALKHRYPPGIETIPEHLHTKERLSKALPNSKYQLSCKFLDTHDLWESLKAQPGWLHRLPESERTPQLCTEYLSRSPGDLTPIPEPILADHPEWRTASASVSVNTSKQPCAYLPLSEHERLSACYSPGTEDSTGSPAPGSVMDKQPWALVLTDWLKQREQLPEHCNKAILDNGGTGGLGETLQVPPLYLDPAALHDPALEKHCSRRTGVVPDQARIQLMKAKAFQLPRAHEGQELRAQMDRHFLDLQQQLNDKSLPLWLPESETFATWKRRGGRTLVHTEKEDCVHMKLQREGEPLSTFAAEQAAQKFASDHPGLGWHSEIPKPGGMYLVPLKSLPLKPEDFPDKLKIHEQSGEQYALAFRFTTQGDNYDTLAWQPDKQGGFQQSQQGLLNALHDLGIWSSMGAMHTSTIRLYHQFHDNEGVCRPELLLNAFFHSRAYGAHAGYPGTLHLWNSIATDQSDWGLSGLRDIGDLELYPFIETYITSPDAKLTAPDYGQRASFVNAIAQNILGGLLHYMRLHRDQDPTWHYKDADSVTDLAEFIEEGCSTLLNGLLDDGTQLKELFAETCKGLDEKACSEWLHLTAREIIYWSAKQEENGKPVSSDSFSVHLNTDGRPSTELYPGHPVQGLRYGEDHDYTEAAGESLGTDRGKMPLFYLVRGLYVIAIGLANRLGGPQHEPAQPPPTGCRIL